MRAKIFLKRNEEKRILSGHLWIFSNEIERTEESPENGDIVEIYDSVNNFLGKGFYNKNSLIAVRILKMDKDDEPESFFKAKIIEAYNLRKKIYPDRDSFRLVFSESDFLPGLIIDKYNHTFVLQVYSAGMEKNIQAVIDILKKDVNAENIFTKNESYFRKLEGLPEVDQIYYGEIKDELINDGIIKYKVDFAAGHKTGFYFDQNDNRFFFQRISKGMKILDAFCNTGGFGLHAAYAGAESIAFVDSSETAIKSAEENFHINKLKCKSTFIAEDVFDYLNKCIEQQNHFDVVNLDPPAFAKNKKSLRSAVKGYEKLNRLALKVIRDGGFLSTSSCSYHLNESEFMKTIIRASEKACKRIQLIYFNNSSVDHPRLPSMPETSYLKYAVFRVYND